MEVSQTQMHRQTHETDSITSAADAGGKYGPMFFQEKSQNMSPDKAKIMSWERALSPH